jgi:hypothetical protein
MTRIEAVHLLMTMADECEDEGRPAQADEWAAAALCVRTAWPQIAPLFTALGSTSAHRFIEQVQEIKNAKR